MEFVYILCFDEPLHHARHYAGKTKNITQRLKDHATGNGARITQVLKEKGINWTLARLLLGYSISEKKLKLMKNSPRYCPICQKNPLRIKGAIDYPIETFCKTNFIQSQEIRKYSSCTNTQKMESGNLTQKTDRSNSQTLLQKLSKKQE